MTSIPSSILLLRYRPTWIVSNNLKELLEIAIKAALSGGEEVLKVYSQDFEVEFKSDESPLTKADQNAHNAIEKMLLNVDLPILSEEGKSIPYSERKDWNQFWMVDPLDGTKEFVKRNGEFTVNIALIEDGKPTMGVIYIPVAQTLYFADKLAYKIENFSESTFSIHTLLGKAEQLPLTLKRDNFIVLASRSHMNETTTNYINEVKENFPNLTITSKGSSLKLCMIAEGSADIQRGSGLHPLESRAAFRETYRSRSRPETFSTSGDPGDSLAIVPAGCLSLARACFLFSCDEVWVPQSHLC